MTTAYTNTDDGIEARVSTKDDGRHRVTLHDLDAGETFPHSKTFPVSREEYAHTVARQWAGLA